MRFFALLLLQVLVGIFDHDDDGIHHRADGNGNAAQRHDIGTDALAEHDQKGNQHRDRQDDDGHEGAAQMHKKGEADQRHDEAFFEELFFQCLDGAINQRAAVIGDAGFHVPREAFHRLLQLLLHFHDDLPRIGAVAHHDHTAHGFAFAIQLRDAAPHVRAQFNVGDLPK